MEETDDGQCSVVYYCLGGQDDFSHLYHASNPPAVTPGAHIYNNVCRLLDEDQGNFEQGEAFAINRSAA